MTVMLVQNHSHMLDEDDTDLSVMWTLLAALCSRPSCLQEAKVPESGNLCVCDVPPPFFSNWWPILICGIQCNVGSVDLKFTFCPIHHIHIRKKASYCRSGRTIIIASCLYFICLASWQQKYNIHVMNHDAYYLDLVKNREILSLSY